MFLTSPVSSYTYKNSHPNISSTSKFIPKNNINVTNDTVVLHPNFQERGENKKKLASWLFVISDIDTNGKPDNYNGTMEAETPYRNIINQFSNNGKLLISEI